jgi:hypothetical protein
MGVNAVRTQCVLRTNSCCRLPFLALQHAGGSGIVHKKWCVGRTRSKPAERRTARLLGFERPPPRHWARPTGGLRPSPCGRRVRARPSGRALRRHLSFSPEARYRATGQNPQPGSSGPSVGTGVALSAVAGGVAVRGHRDAVTNRSGTARHLGRRGRAVVVGLVCARPRRAVGVDVGRSEVVRR